MIDRVYIECGGATIAPYEDYGIILKSFDAPPPAVKAYRVNLEGANGALDMTEWAGEPKYNDRAVTVELRDFGKNHGELINKIAGRKCKIWLSSEIDYYYEGRCDSISAQTRRRVTDLTLNFTCSPWKLKNTLTTVTADFTTSEATTVALKSGRMTAVPLITPSNACYLTWGTYTNYTVATAKTLGWPLITEAGTSILVQGIVNGGTITFSWRDGVL